VYVCRGDLSTYGKIENYGKWQLATGEKGKLWYIVTWGWQQHFLLQWHKN